MPAHPVFYFLKCTCKTRFVANHIFIVYCTIFRNLRNIMVFEKLRAVLPLPTLWRYFLTQYIKVFSLSLFGFLVILLSTRLEDFARFISLGADLPATFLYLLYQIPYVLQIALPISSLIASLYLFQKLSQNQALTSLRAAGISLFELVAPLILFSIFLALITFHFLLDVSATSHREAKQLEFRLRSMNPLALMHNSKLMEEKGFNVDMKGSLQREGEASDFILAMRSGENNKATLFIAKNMKVHENHIKGSNIAFISTFENQEPAQSDHLVIENSKENIIHLDDLSSAVNTKRLRLGNDDLKLALLIAKKNDLSKQYQERKFLDKSTRYVNRLLARCYSEFTRRISLSFSIITFAILGAAFGITIGRLNSRKRIIYALILTSFFLVCYLGAKAMDESPMAASVLYFLPHVVIISISIVRLSRIQKGILVS